jgi:uncharacterized membrane protein YfcA
MTFTEALLVLGTGLIAGSINTVAGGGSLLSLPILIFLGLPPAVANATNRVAIFSQNAFAVLGFKSKGISNFRYSLLLGMSALLGAVIGARIAVDLRGDIFNKILSILMIIVVFFIVSGKGKPRGTSSEKSGRAQMIAGTIIFFFVGIYGGFIQAGVGFLIIGSLNFLHGYNLVKINSMKVFIVLVYTIAALGVFIYEGKINWMYGGVLAIGNSVGAWFASRWSVARGDKVVKIILTVAVIGLSIKLWFI